MILAVVLLLAGCALLAVAVRRRSGRAGRAWATAPFPRQAWLFCMPGTSLMLIGGGVMLLGDAADLAALTVLALGVFAVGAVIFLWGALFLPVPGWALPAWVRPGIEREKRATRERRAGRRQRRQTKEKVVDA